MKKLDNIITSLKSFEENIFNLIEKVIRDNEEIVLEYNSIDQLYEQGENRLGVKISDYQPYTLKTVSIKKRKGQPTNRVTLSDERDFYRSFYILYSSTGFEVKAKDKKTEDLLRKYGKQILGINDENFNDLKNNYVKPYVMSKMRSV